MVRDIIADYLEWSLMKPRTIFPYVDCVLFPIPILLIFI